MLLPRASALLSAPLFAAAALAFSACTTVATSAPGGADGDDAGSAALPTEPRPLPSSDGGADGAAPTPEVDACVQYAEARCARDAQCRENAFTIDYAAKSDCVSARTKECEGRIGISGSRYAKADAAACAAAYASFGCAEVLVGRVPAACVPPAGTLALRAVCADDAQCASGVCLFESHQECGRCSEKSPAASIQRCSSSAQCPQGEACKSMSSSTMLNGTCRPLARDGEYCSNNYCGAGTFCVSGVCTATRELGEECGPFAGPCDPAKGLACDVFGKLGPANRCVAPVRKFKLDGECDSSGLCEQGSYCVAYPGFGVSVCQEMPAVGEKCESTCAPPARCAGSGDARRCVLETASTCK